MSPTDPGKPSRRAAATRKKGRLDVADGPDGTIVEELRDATPADEPAWLRDADVAAGALRDPLAPVDPDADRRRAEA